MTDRVPVPHRVATGHGGLRLDRYLHLRFPWWSRTAIQRLIEQGVVEGARPLKPASRLLEGEDLTLWLERRAGEDPGPMPDLAVIYEDDWLIAIDKPAGLLSHPARFDRRLAAVTVLRRRFADLGSPVRPTLAHRLDRETSGVLLLSKDARSDRRVKKAFMGRRVEKSYLAVVRGVPDWDEVDVDQPIGPARGSEIGIQQAVVEDGLPARTRFRVEARVTGRALVRAWPLTGRMHQIRVHLAHLGLPLVGDKIYGRPAACFLGYLEHGLTPDLLAELELPRHALHAAELALDHPATGQPLRISAPLPEDLRLYLEAHRPGDPT